MDNSSASAPLIRGATFSRNSAVEGGGMYNEAASSPTLTNATFSSNTASDNGGGMANDTSSPILGSVTFVGNHATNWGGGMYNNASAPTIVNATFSKNTAAAGGAISNENSSAPVLKFVTVSGNDATVLGDGLHSLSGSTSSIQNSIFWGNGTQEVFFASSTVTITNSIVKGGCPGASCTNVSGSNPKLAPLANNGGFTKTMALQLGSAAIDKVACLGVNKDQRGIRRPQGPKCDMGAYEYKP
jgi:predicted outer membrane repeat protein